MKRKPPTPERVRAIIEHMESLGAYTQAEEIAGVQGDRDHDRRIFMTYACMLRKIVRTFGGDVRVVERYGYRLTLPQDHPSPKRAVSANRAQAPYTRASSWSGQSIDVRASR